MNENPGAAVPSGTEADPAVLSDAATRLNVEFGPGGGGAPPRPPTRPRQRPPPPPPRARPPPRPPAP
ncbi:hypothetical protein ACFXO7_37135, partial [Nocardia tengchongensis]|uniref:hypothetical protein n=1 Tax=Nocardia tengchongensis TaxID=2055889 RepID=UPI0036C2E59D